jgi:hypothetical protein
MSLVNLSIQHGRTFEDARARLETAVDEVRTRFGPLVRAVEWSAGRDAVTIVGNGFTIALRVDPREVHASGDIPILAAFFGDSFQAQLTQIVRQTFEKQLPSSS